MKPLNTQDRMKQFFIFLAFFIVTVILVTAVVYFDFSNPKEHNRLLIEENASLKKQIEANQLYVKSPNWISLIPPEWIPDMESQIKKMLPLKMWLNPTQFWKTEFIHDFLWWPPLFLIRMKPINLPNQKQMNLIWPNLKTINSTGKINNFKRTWSNVRRKNPWMNNSETKKMPRIRGIFFVFNSTVWS